MCFSAIAVGLVAAAQGAVLEARDTECTVYLEPTVDEPRGAGELITLGSIDRWVDATGLLPFDSVCFLLSEVICVANSRWQSMG